MTEMMNRHIVRPFFLFCILFPFFSGCVAATVGGALVGLLPASFDYVDKNSPSSTQNIKLEDAEDIAVITLRDLGFSIDEVRKNTEEEGNGQEKLVSKEVLAHPSQREKKSVRVSVHIVRITGKVTKFVVVAKDSSLAYDGATARAILDEILINLEREKGYVDLDSYRFNQEQKQKTEQEIARAEKKYGVKSINGKQRREVPKQKEERTIMPPADAETAPSSVTELPVEVSAQAETEVTKEPSALKPGIKREIPATPSPWTIKIGTFQNHKNIRNLVRLWQERGEHPFVSSLLVKGRTYYRVFLNRFKSREEAKEFSGEMREKGFLTSDAHPYFVPFSVEVGRCYSQEECWEKLKRIKHEGVEFTPYTHSFPQGGDMVTLLLIGGFGSAGEAADFLKELQERGINAFRIKP